MIYVMSIVTFFKYYYQIVLFGIDLLIDYRNIGEISSLLSRQERDRPDKIDTCHSIQKVDLKNRKLLTWLSTKVSNFLKALLVAWQPCSDDVVMTPVSKFYPKIS